MRKMHKTTAIFFVTVHENVLWKLFVDQRFLKAEQISALILWPKLLLWPEPVSVPFHLKKCLLASLISASLQLIMYVIHSEPLVHVAVQKQVTSGWPPREAAQRSAGHCPYEAAPPRVTCCPLSSLYLSLSDSSFFFLSKPLLFHLPFSSLFCWVWHRSSSPFAKAGYQGQSRVDLVAALPSRSHDIPFRGLSNNEGRAMSFSKVVHRVHVLLRGPPEG